MPTAATIAEQAVQLFQITREQTIDAPIEIVFQATLDQLGPECQLPDGTPMPFKIELWPGGHWFRDLGNNAGHLWGHVQVIKPPKLLELCGPLAMSYAAINHLQYRLTPEGGGTRLTFTHQALGLIPPEHRDRMSEGWKHWLKRIDDLAKRRHRASQSER